MLQSTNGSLVIIDANTNSPSIFWKGQKVDNIVRVKVIDSRVVISLVGGTQPDIYTDMRNNGIKVKVGK